MHKYHKPVRERRKNWIRNENEWSGSKIVKKRDIQLDLVFALALNNLSEILKRIISEQMKSLRFN